MKTDTLLFADVFENFRKTYLKTYQLDPLHFYRSLILSSDASLKSTKIELDLIKDQDTLLLIGKETRGGICRATKRCAKANIPYIKVAYDGDKPNSYVTYLEANSIYGLYMRQYLPHGKFRW